MTKSTHFITVLILSVLMLAQCKTEQSNSTTLLVQETDQFKVKGQAITGETFGVLSTNLMNAMKTGGVKNAVEYCNLAAMPLVDSLSKLHNVNIRRTSLKVRNPLDQPTAIEKEQLLAYQKQFDSGDDLSAQVVVDTQNRTYYFAPIFVNTACLKCHGVPGEILDHNNYEFIKSKYPNDLAIGYQNGDLRGMWSIEFNLNYSFRKLNK